MLARNSAWPEKHGGYISTTDRTISFTVIFVSLASLFWVLNLSRYGIDFTDEGYYLNSISKPTLYAVNVPLSMFGFVFNPLYEVLGRDVALLRQAGVMSTYALAWTLSFLSLRILWATRELLPTAAIAAAVACVALVYYSYMLTTPSYNLLAFQSLMIVSLGMVLIWRGNGVTSWSLVGLGGWLLFMAKPSSAAMIALVVPLCLLAMGRFRLKAALLAAAVTAVLMLASSILIDGSPVAFANRLLTSMKLLQLVGSGHGLALMFRIDVLNLGKADVIMIAFWVLTIAVLAFLGLTRWRFGKATASVVCLAAAAALLIYSWSGFPVYKVANNLYLFPLALASMAITIASIAFFGFPSWKQARAPLALGVFFLVLPHVYIFGSNSGYWEWGSGAGFFWVLSALSVCGVLFQSGSRPRVAAFVPVAVVFPVLTAVLLDRGVNLPYRQPPDVRSFSTPYKFADGGSLILPTGFAEYLTAASRTAADARLLPGMDVIDLTGQSGGVLYALGLNSVGLPWLAGGYPGSNALAGEIFSTQSCSTMAGAWLLDEPEGHRRISPDELGRFGAQFETDYELVGSFQVAEYAGGRDKGVRPTQNLYRPTRSPIEAEKTCERTKHSRPDT